MPAFSCPPPTQVGRRPHTQTEACQHSHEGATAVQTSERADQQLRLGEIPGAGTQHAGTFSSSVILTPAHEDKIVTSCVSVPTEGFTLSLPLCSVLLHPLPLSLHKVKKGS